MDHSEVSNQPEGENLQVNYQKILESIMDAVGYATLVNAEGRIIYMSKSYCEDEIGLPQEEIIGKHIFEIVPDSRIPAIMDGGKTVLGEYYHLPNLNENLFANRYPLYNENHPEKK